MSLIFLLGEDAISWLLNDQFSTNASAPLVSGAPAEPGPGVRTIADTTNLLSIAGGKVISTTAAVSSYVDPRVVYASQVRAAGLAMLFNWNVANNTAAGFFNSAAGGIANATEALYSNTGNVLLFRTVTPMASITGATDYQYCIILESSGAYYFAKGGSQFPTWTLIFYDTTGTTSTLYPIYAIGGGAANRYLDSLKIRQLPAPFTSPPALATLTQASPVTATDYTANVNGIKLVTFTAPAVLVDSNELRFRVLDGSNYFTAYFNSAGALRVDTVVSGTPTNRVNAAGVIAGGQTRTIAVSSRGTIHDIWTLSGTTWTNQATITVSTPMDSAATVRLAIGVGSTAANLQSYARTNAAWSTELDRTS